MAAAGALAAVSMAVEAICAKLGSFPDSSVATPGEGMRAMTWAMSSLHGRRTAQYTGGGQPGSLRKWPRGEV